METYPHLVSSQICLLGYVFLCEQLCYSIVNKYSIDSHILVEFVTYLVTVKINAFIIIIIIKYHIFSYFIIYIYTVKRSLCINILNSQNMLGKIFANEKFHRKLMFSGDIELNPGSVFL